MQESILSTVIHVTSHLELSKKFCGSFACLQISSPPVLGGLVSKDPLSQASQLQHSLNRILSVLEGKAPSLHIWKTAAPQNFVDSSNHIMSQASVPCTTIKCDQYRLSTSTRQQRLLEWTMSSQNHLGWKSMFRKECQRNGFHVPHHHGNIDLNFWFSTHEHHRPPQMIQTNLCIMTHRHIVTHCKHPHNTPGLNEQNLLVFQPWLN